MQKRIKLLWMVLLACAFIFTAASAQTSESTPSSALKIDKIACGTGVIDRELQGQDTAFTESTEKVYCWVTILGGSEGTTVNFVWYHDSKEVVKVPIVVNFSRTRTWSYKSMYPGAKGEWKVEVTDSNNQVLGSTSFTIH